MINTHYLELPLSRTYFYGPKGVRAIEVLLYITSGDKSCSLSYQISRFEKKELY